jgi:hypothetical protein
MIAVGVLLVVGRVIATVLLAVVTTAISLRLLGMRRGWVMGLVSGVLVGRRAFVGLGLSSWIGRGPLRRASPGDAVPADGGRRALISSRQARWPSASRRVSSPRPDRCVPYRANRRAPE